MKNYILKHVYILINKYINAPAAERPDYKLQSPGIESRPDYQPLMSPVIDKQLEIVIGNLKISTNKLDISIIDVNKNYYYY